MLKLPKGLKKKKKKSKKDQELFTEEELEQYKREQRLKQEQFEQPQANQENFSETGATTSDTEQKPQQEEPPAGAAAPVQENKTGEEDEEWSKFKALTAGVDTILHKTQDELDRIKSTSFYQRVPTELEKKKHEEEEAKAREAQKLEEERKRKEEEEANRDKLAEAVVELSESEEESEELNDIFETGYIDAITSGEIQLGVVPDSPEFEDLGPDPFDTAYADTVIVGPQVSKTGKKLVALGSAVEVLTGRVDSAQAVALSGAKRKPRRGITNLLLENEEVANLPEELSATPEPPKTLLDDFDDEIPDIPIDLSVSLHLTLLNQKKEGEEGTNKNVESPKEEQTNRASDDILSEFDVLKDDEDDEFAELAAESLTKKEEIKVLTQPQPVQFSSTLEGNWAEFELTEEEKAQHKAKPPRPPRPPTGPPGANALPVGVDELSDDEFNVPEDDPFDTAFVEQVIVKDNDEDDDFDFDPRAGEEVTEVKKVTKEDIFANLSGEATSNSLAPIVKKDLLSGSNTNLAQSPIAPAQESVDVEDEDFDPFDTSRIGKLVEPKETELKILEKDLLSDSNLKNSLSDPDFDPRAGEPEEPKPQIVVPPADFDPARRKSSLSLNIQSKSVGFLVPNTDLLIANSEGGKIQKPLTPYYAHPEAIEEKDLEDPFDTSFVPKTVPTEVELKHIEKDLLTSSTLKHSLSDPDFDPRSDDNKEISKPASDLLAVEENLNIKVLTPKFEDKKFFIQAEVTSDDPFDTSIASNIQPGKTELKLLEDELLPPTTPEITTGVLDTLTDAQELGLGDKVLTPHVTTPPSDGIEEIDPFDTSFAINLGPGQIEIKLIESEFSEKKY